MLSTWVRLGKRRKDSNIQVPCYFVGRPETRIREIFDEAGTKAYEYG